MYRIYSSIAVLMLGFSSVSSANSAVSDEFYRLMDNNSISFTRKYSNEERRNYLYVLLEKYECFLQEREKNKTTYKIPKIIHQIWLGKKPIPDFYQEISKSWKKFHPDWEYKLWTDEDIQDMHLINENYFNATNDVREKSDILRYEILYRWGGIYVDMDYECVHALDDLHILCDFYTGISANDTTEVINNALIAARPGHPIIKHSIDTIAQDSTMNTIYLRTGPLHFQKSFFTAFSEHDDIVVAFPSKIFYPINYRADITKPLSDYIIAETRAIHYWGNRNGFNK